MATVVQPNYPYLNLNVGDAIHVDVSAGVSASLAEGEVPGLDVDVADLVGTAGKLVNKGPLQVVAPALASSLWMGGVTYEKKGTGGASPLHVGDGSSNGEGLGGTKRGGPKSIGSGIPAMLVMAGGGSPVQDFENKLAEKLKAFFSVEELYRLLRWNVARLADQMPTGSVSLEGYTKECARLFVQQNDGRYDGLWAALLDPECGRPRRRDEILALKTEWERVQGLRAQSQSVVLLAPVTPAPVASGAVTYDPALVQELRAELTAFASRDRDGFLNLYCAVVQDARYQGKLVEVLVADLMGRLQKLQLFATVHASYTWVMWVLYEPKRAADIMALHARWWNTARVEMTEHEIDSHYSELMNSLGRLLAGHRSFPAKPTFAEHMQKKCGLEASYFKEDITIKNKSELIRELINASPEKRKQFWTAWVSYWFYQDPREVDSILEIMEIQSLQKRLEVLYPLKQALLIARYR